jgi:predicted RNA-binding protein YlxR (DUF448 family)/ribosomal protein L7Ae-like RNA K-turn-binding protein
MTGKAPQRSCLGCKATRDKKELLRFVLAPDRTLVPDILAKLPGRGAYTCLNHACLRNAAQKKQFARAFSGDVVYGGADQLISKVVILLEERIGSYLALANKAGRVVSGSDMVMELLKKKKAGVVFLATDISPEIGAKVMALAKRYEVPHVAIFAKERIGAFLGKGLRSVAAIEQSGFIETVTREIAKYRNFFEGGTDAR